MQTQYVHPRLGLPRFLSFEPYFLAALEAFDRGEDTRIVVQTELSINTIAARMRDSLQGLRLNLTAWKDRIDPRLYELFTKHDGKFVIAGPTPEGELWFRTRKPTGRKDRPVQFSQVEGELVKHIRLSSVPQPPKAASTLRAKNCDPSTVITFVSLKTSGNLEPGIIFPGPIDPQLTADLMSKHDIAFHFDPQRNETILV